MSQGTRIGVDIGGTFTDLVLVDDDSGALTVGKLLTTPENPARAVEAGITALIRDAGASAQSVKTLVHATTLATNAIIERRGGKTALVTTKGFRDAIEIAREGRYDTYDLMIDPPAPLVQRRMRFEVAERILADGSVLVPLEDGQAVSVIRAPRPSRSRCFMRTSTRSTNGAWPHCSQNSRRTFRLRVHPRLRPRFASTNELRPR
jgi:N-methylhydantoinase A